MAKIKYYYDTETCKYERIKTSTSDIVLNLLAFFAVSGVIAIGIVYVFSKYFESPQQAYLRKENQELSFYYKIMSKELEDATSMLTTLQRRDDDLYRVIFGVDPLPNSVRNAGAGGSERYKDLLEKGLDNEEMILSSLQKIDKLRKQMYIQTKSHDEIAKLAKHKEEMWASVPAIQPVSNKELTRLASGFGMRVDPIYKVRKMHTGCDFSAPKGTPIYATGDGKVIKVKTNFWYYGKEIEIDHGHGYVTKYAHMEAFNVKQGQRIKRGECIGFVGNSGKSTAPHLHYEVIKDGKKLNPVNFFYQDLNPDEYEKLLELASTENQSLGGGY